jgi:cytochrome c5
MRNDDRWLVEGEQVTSTASLVLGHKKPHAPVRAIIVAAAVAGISLLPGVAQSAAPERTGKQVVDSVCIACHGTGANGAPKIGDRKAWNALASRGLASLSEDALKGIRQMPSHGGNPSLSDIEIQRAITYMVNRSGGHWIEPVSRTTPTAARSGEEIVMTKCADCHESGKNNAPKIGDKSAWIPRLKPGFDSLVQSAIHGHGGMPARGGFPDLTDAEIRSAIAFMIGDPNAAKKR